jgi:Sulfotransferase domain
MRSKLSRYVRSAVPQTEVQERGDDETLRPRVPPSCPSGWHIGPPDYVGVGTQKAGTTWWNQAISSHPQIHSPRKELHFFEYYWNDQFNDVHIEQYHQFFPRPVGKVSGEWTPRYMLDLSTPHRLKMSAPDARILVLLRDPIARLRSGLRHMASHHPGRLHPRLVNDAIAFGRYGEQLDRLSRQFSSSRILILQFERCVQDPEMELARTFDFIGVDRGFVPDSLHNPVNEGQGPKLSIPSDFIEYARELYRADAKLLSRWPEIDLELWPEMKP